MIVPLSIEKFIPEIRSGGILIDTRSPKEFVQGHIPGALNLPLLNDDERHVVGITFKEKGQEEAVKKGFELVGHKFNAYINEAEKKCPSKILYLYCWRGGMRSNVMAWVLSLAGFNVHLLTRGYKSYRHYCLEQFRKERLLLLLSGKTGTGKSEALQLLLKSGEQVIDLEKLASHRGSAFGGMGQSPQPNQEQFENDLGWELGNLEDRLLWVEDESRFVGKLRIPDAFFEMMFRANIVELVRSMDSRTQRIIDEYGHFPIKELEETTRSITKRMGGDRVKESVTCLLNGDMSGWLKPLFDYYDRAYVHGMNERKSECVALLNADQMDAKNIVESLKSAAKKMKHRIPE